MAAAGTVSADVVEDGVGRLPQRGGVAPELAEQQATPHGGEQGDRELVRVRLGTQQAAGTHRHQPGAHRGLPVAEGGGQIVPGVRIDLGKLADERPERTTAPAQPWPRAGREVRRATR